MAWNAAFAVFPSDYYCCGSDLYPVPSAKAQPSLALKLSPAMVSLFRNGPLSLTMNLGTLFRTVADQVCYYSSAVLGSKNTISVVLWEWSNFKHAHICNLAKQWPPCTFSKNVKVIRNCVAFWSSLSFFYDGLVTEFAVMETLPSYNLVHNFANLQQQINSSATPTTEVITASHDFIRISLSVLITPWGNHNMSNISTLSHFCTHHMYFTKISHYLY